MRTAGLALSQRSSFNWERATTTAEQRAPELKQKAQQSAQASAFDDGDGAAAYADTATQDFTAEPTSRLRRDR
jgi:hypothetical protein